EEEEEEESSSVDADIFLSLLPSPSHELMSSGLTISSSDIKLKNVDLIQ
ncbi:hypothetical protein ADUPG1_014769, partial [Aduncisulcus paluster]